MTTDPLRAGASELLRAADVAMYEAKRRGKNDIEVFSPHLDQLSEGAAMLPWPGGIRTPGQGQPPGGVSYRVR